MDEIKVYELCKNNSVRKIASEGLSKTVVNYKMLSWTVWVDKPSPFQFQEWRIELAVNLRGRLEANSYGTTLVFHSLFRSRAALRLGRSRSRFPSTSPVVETSTCTSPVERSMSPSYRILSASGERAHMYSGGSGYNNNDDMTTMDDVDVDDNNNNNNLVNHNHNNNDHNRDKTITTTTITIIIII